MATSFATRLPIFMRATRVGFGRLFISNPDLPTRIRMGAGLAELRHEGLYGGGPAGYTDYPELQTAN